MQLYYDIGIDQLCKRTGGPILQCLVDRLVDTHQNGDRFVAEMATTGDVFPGFGR